MPSVDFEEVEMICSLDSLSICHRFCLCALNRKMQRNKRSWFLCPCVLSRFVQMHYVFESHCGNVCVSLGLDRPHAGCLDSILLTILCSKNERSNVILFQYIPLFTSLHFVPDHIFQNPKICKGQYGHSLQSYILQHMHSENLALHILWFTRLMCRNPGLKNKIVPLSSLALQIVTRIVLITSEENQRRRATKSSDCYW